MRFNWHVSFEETLGYCYSGMTHYASFLAPLDVAMVSPRLSEQRGSGLNFYSWNCRALNNPVKCSKVLLHHQHLGSPIIYSKETHFRVSDQTRLKSSWIGQIFHSSVQGEHRRAARILHKSIHFVPSNVISDPNGRNLIISGKM